MMLIKSQCLPLLLFCKVILLDSICCDSQILDCSTSNNDSSLCLEKDWFNRSELNVQDRRDINVVCTNREVDANEDWKQQANLCSSNATQPKQAKNIIEVYIRPLRNGTQFEFGSTIILECGFNTSLNQDIKFSLRWLRSVAGSQVNQSIIISEKDSEHQAKDEGKLRVRTVQRNGVLDLELNDFQLGDVGDYFCQAISANLSGKRSILGEARMRLLEPWPSQANPPNDQVSDSYSYYSQENLSKLLPSLAIIPTFSEVSLGESVQLACLTSSLDPDPEPIELKWSFEPIADRNELMRRPLIAVDQMPHNVSDLGNLLIIWSLTEQHLGLYKCTLSLPEFNLSVQATSELWLRPQHDSAPLVFVSPELVRLAPNGSGSVSCEATGYPPPELVWYRVDLSTRVSQEQSSIEKEGVRIEQIPHRDALFWCHLNNCLALNQAKGAQVTAISLLQLRNSRFEHQGQYVCRASNKHGSNQASMIVDYEYKERPRVSIGNEFKEQTIELPTSGSDNLMEAHFQNKSSATFKCAIESGFPRPRLRWLRFSGNPLKEDNLDLYDLSKISTATSKISLQVEDDGQSLVLKISTVSLNDEGDYICLGENVWGRHSAVGRLLIRKAASVKILQTSPLKAKVNESFHLDCLASGYPMPLDLEWSQTQRGAFFSLLSGAQQRAVLKFDRVGVEDAGEYICNARNPLNSSEILRDTIMVLVDEQRNETDLAENQSRAADNVLLPKLMVRPTKTSAQVGSTITLDCLTVSGLQPTLVEWLAPFLDNSSVQTSQIMPYYRTSSSLGGQLLQFGSKLRIINLNKAHEGLYQCKGRNRLGVETAPALIKVLEEKQLQKPIKVAKIGSNIELKCQVTGIEQSATSWSRDGLELPANSVQIGHNLWIQNVTNEDEGLYICSARSHLVNKVMQAGIKLTVQAEIELDEAHSKRRQNLNAKIVASKSQIHLGDSITLECIVSQASELTNHSLKSVSGPDELELGVVWTNEQLGQTMFQENVYIVDNLLIIYELRQENLATYRCNFNEMSQHTDYKLQVASRDESSNRMSVSLLVAKNGQSAQLRQVVLNSQLILECTAPKGKTGEYFWLKGQSKQRVGKPSSALSFERIAIADADLYQCVRDGEPDQSLVVQVLSPAARFLQRPVSFIAVPTISSAESRLDIRLKFLPERENGLILFSGQHQAPNRSQVGDFILLGLSKGHLEFRFDLGDGRTLLRSNEPLALNEWHKVVIERNRRSAVMWLDDQPPISNSSAGNFFNLNLESLLYVGGHQYFLNKSRHLINKQPFRSYTRGFQGCISELRMANKQVDLVAHNRSLAISVTECEKLECKQNECSAPNGQCQVDRRWPEIRQWAEPAPLPDWRCICLPSYSGDRCQIEGRPDSPAAELRASAPPKAVVSGPAATSPKPVVGACETSQPCSSNGTIECQSLTSTSFKCHCKLGFMGETCALIAKFDSETSLWFNDSAYLQFRFNSLEEAQQMRLANQSQEAQNGSFDASLLTKLGSQADQQDISFKLRTKSSYGLIFYMGKPTLLDSNATLLSSQVQSSKSMVANLLARLSNTKFDYLAVALVDGHIELSFDLGSGVAVIRSSKRVNDAHEHQIRILRKARLATLVIDGIHKHEGTSPGKLTQLNVQEHVYLGGLPQLASVYLSGFAGCLSELEINSLGPLNLVRSNHLTQPISARNLAPCPLHLEIGRRVEPPAQSEDMKQAYKPYQAPEQHESDDPDEM